ncbi:MAG: hypothetical protein M3024_08675 [Candidatus Dormibacteraeota bacterium]|nr:hypothetical protein [Candidatus Dormibacteraeota bacterium]
MTLVTRKGSDLIDSPLTSESLVAAVDIAFGRLAAELSLGFPSDRPFTVRLRGWSLADHLEHLSAWDEVERARAEGRRSGAAAWILVGQAIGRRVRPRTDAQGAWERLEARHAELREALLRLPEWRLRRPWHPAYPTTLAADLLLNTSTHYDDHLSAIRALLAAEAALPADQDERSEGRTSAR